MQHNTLPKQDVENAVYTLRLRLGFICIGMAIGAGTVLMPVQIGLKGIWVFTTAAIIAYPATWVVQDIYLKTLSESDSVMTTPILSMITLGVTGEFSSGLSTF